MNPLPIHEIRTKVLEAVKELCQTRKDMLITVAKLLNEVAVFKEKEKLYFQLEKTFKALTPSLTRQRLMYRATERKFNILAATSEMFDIKRRETLEKEMLVGKWVKPLLTQAQSDMQTLSGEELALMLQDYEKGIIAMTDVHKDFKDLVTDWNQLKVEMHTMIDDCIRRMHEIIA